MKHLSFLLIISLLAIGSLIAQAPTSDAGWSTLARVTFDKKFDELLGLSVDIPKFSKVVKELEGERIKLRGYVIPTEGYKSHKEFIFSAYPYSMCFFCGGAGPESVIEVFAKEPIEYSADAIEITGVLKLNGGDPNALMYSLEDVEMVD